MRDATFICPVCNKTVKVKNAGIAIVGNASVSVGMDCQRKIRATKGQGLIGINGQLFKSI